MAKRSKQADPAERTNELLRKMTIIQLGLAGGRPSPNQGDRRRRDGGYHDYRSIAEIRPSWKGMEMSDDDATVAVLQKLVDSNAKLVETLQDLFTFYALTSGVPKEDIRSLLRVDQRRGTKVSKIRPKKLRPTSEVAE